ncbi:XRE family transcriptional regulator [Gordonibacter sp. 28C]|uniref:helix-turn-helix domain-containing protein n=1 Tax=Gordonibacter sp. 28C TaxID=2078569 RepID=UPI000DF7813F|nr:helix-turn-helix transcriptional regulator [Gordonibacter sp. 28C]RDB62798.1 XRE family transcriptional regulator [Gordonibacter sp. 28C]
MNVEIAQRLSARRKQSGLSQEALAEKLGVSRQAVSKWERSESSPDTDNLIALAQLYGVSLDELLYVDDEMRDDVAFEAVDRAAERAAAAGAQVPGAAVGGAASGAQVPGAAAAASAEAASQPANVDPGPEDPARDVAGEGPSDASSAAPGGTGGKDSKVRIGLGGIHVLDGDDYVHVSWRDGVHVKDGKKGDEVHVGWDGIHVKEAAGSRSGDWRAAADAWCNEDDPRERDHSAARAWYGKDGAGGSARQDSQKDDDSRCTLEDDDGNEVVIDGEGVVINGEHFDSWHDAHDRYGHGHIHEDRWYEPCGYTVNGERFDTLDDAKAKYGPEVGRTIPVRKHYLRTFEKSWARFPYPLVVILAYLLLGIFNGAWGMGLFLFFTIPVYYMIGHAIGRRRLAPLIEGAYPIGVTAWFCYMAFVLNQWHPAWVAFLTIPLVEWLVHSLSRWWRARKREKEAAKTAPIDVEAQ